MWYSIRLGKHAAGEAGHQCWSLLAAALRARPDVHCSWMPSHRTAKEAVKLAIPEGWHRGNGEADDRAKEASLARDLPQFCWPATWRTERLPRRLLPRLRQSSSNG